MFGNTGKQLKLLGKEVLGIFKAIKNDVCLELKVQKELITYRKELYELVKEQKADATRAHEEPKS